MILKLHNGKIDFSAKKGSDCAPLFLEIYLLHPYLIIERLDRIYFTKFENKNKLLFSK